MNLYGSIVENLDHALLSVRRLRGQPVYNETLSYWGDLLLEAQRIQQDPSCPQQDAIGLAIARLERELAERV